MVIGAVPPFARHATAAPSGDPLRSGTAVFGDGLPPTDDTPWRGTFRDPRATWTADTLDDVLPVVDAAEHAVAEGAWVVLVLAYEAAPAFDAALQVHAGLDAPLAWAAAYDGPAGRDGSPSRPRAAASCLPDWQPALDAASFADVIARLQTHIAAGDTYQVNYTFPMRGVLPAGAAWAWYDFARHRAAVPYAAWIAREDDLVLSLSPELFFERRGTRITTRPMKGTHARGRWLAEDLHARDALERSEKARAENVMIVDLLRNDLGRIARPGTVRVTRLCTPERYPSVWQLTSTIEAEASADVRLRHVLSALFPCGSVTGAPKIRTTEIIAASETAPRGVYTGAIALIRPDGQVVASVPIRTAVVDRRSGRAIWPVGAGITADSDAADEYAECLLKAKAARTTPVVGAEGLFETLRLEMGVLTRRDAHVRRLAESARYLGLPWDAAAADAALDACAAAHPSGLWRIRLVLDADGRCACTAEPFADAPERVWRVGLAPLPVAADDWRLFHKTVDRERYDTARRAHPLLDDVIFCRPDGRVTESTIANVVVELDDGRWTPPVGDGLLPGVYRGTLLAAGTIGERSLTVDDVRSARRVWLINSLRGWMEAEPR